MARSDPLATQLSIDLGSEVPGLGGVRRVRWLGGGESALVGVVEGAEGSRLFKVARPGFEDVLLEEGRLLGRLGGFGVPRLLGACVVSRERRPALVLEFVRGRTLAEVIEGGPLSAEQAAAFVVDVGGTLVELEEVGLRHGDVKPENVLFGEDGRFRLLDLGLGASVEAPILGGTPRYLPPEWATEPRARETCDSYAFGSVLAEALLGERSDGVDGFGEYVGAFGVYGELIDALTRREAFARGGIRYLRAFLRSVAASSDGRSARERARIRRAYLGLRASALERGARPSTRVFRGELRAWLEEATNLESELRGAFGLEEPVSPPLLGELSSLERLRFFGGLFGVARGASLVERFADRDDAAVIEALLVHVEGEPLAAFRDEDGDDATVPTTLLDAQKRHLLGRLRDRDCRSLESLVEGEEPRLLAATAHRLNGRYWRALEGTAGLGSDRALWQRALVLERLGVRAESERILRDLSGGTGEVASLAAAQLARYAFERGEAEQARALLDGVGSPLLARVVEMRALLELAEGRPEEAERVLGTLARALLEPEDEARVAAMHGYLWHQRGAPERATVWFEKAVELAERHLGAQEVATYSTSLAAARADAGRLEESLGDTERALVVFEAEGRTRELGYALLARASALEQLGLRTEALQTIEWAKRVVFRVPDRRLAGYLDLCACDVLLDDRREEARAAVLRAASSLGELDLDRLRVDARLLLVAEPPRTFDDETVDGIPSVEARSEWWRARGEMALESRDLALAEKVALALRRVLEETRSSGQGVRSAAVLYRLLRELGRAGEANEVRMRGRRFAEDFLARLSPRLRVTVETSPTFRPFTAGLEESVGVREQLAEVERLLRSLGRGDGLGALLRGVLDALLLWAGGERGLLLLRAPGGRLSIRAARHLRRGELSKQQLLLSRSMAERAVREVRPIVLTEARTTSEELGRSIHALALRSVMVVPLVARGEVLGVAYLDDKTRTDSFGEKAVGWASLVATVAGLAIVEERDRLSLARALGRARRAEGRLASELAKTERELSLAHEELRAARPEAHFDGRFANIVGRGPKMLALLSLVERVAQSDVPVLIVGESGTGKELVARAIAESGARAARPFVAENCAAIPETLLESTLFGHVKGAFTGAVKTQAGLFEMADGGTLFLDEIGEMSLGMQARLLRVLQTGEVRPLGAEKSRFMNVRVLAATHRDLAELVRAGTFREDLYYRLTVVPVRVPPLRERVEDIGPLIDHFSRLYGDGRSLPRAIRDKLVRYSWPGNVRQLENEVRRLWVLGGPEVPLSELSPDILENERGSAGRTLHDRLDALSRKLVEEALQRFEGNRTRAAESLGLSRFGLQKMIERLGLADPAKRRKAGRSREGGVEERG